MFADAAVKRGPPPNLILWPIIGLNKYLGFPRCIIEAFHVGFELSAWKIALGQLLKYISLLGDAEAFKLGQ